MGIRQSIPGCGLLYHKHASCRNTYLPTVSNPAIESSDGEEPSLSLSRLVHSHMCVGFEKESSEPIMTFWNIPLAITMSFRGRDVEVMMDFGQG